ncbi:hypothetical protein H257_10608 [Aphanomyces astaci]|uniref:Uncharacterized protein n=1 Tax=Aphanomyces astaci TaxID=112090 RepID=W4G5Q1_APHAT|nr:hypothetical protein H257_10608 [Aphanomyces astaci]ETV75005.1 hypothetical protein H257_10608 [Aphanomyces astaci]RQM19036.1 hypothetical protein B5M09_008350 [Aphanomyces astaci]|eukprot:XP_009835509.1 hypothetical protein H257_10608 [Aphanomyces astaci]
MIGKQEQPTYAFVDTPKEESGGRPSDSALIQDQNLPAKCSTAQLAPFRQLFQFADATDMVLMAVGTLSAIATGFSQPLQIVFFGDLINVFGSASSGFDLNIFEREMNEVVFKFIGVAAAILVSGFGQIACWSIASSRQTKRLREAYAAAILRQDIGWFDVHEPAQLATNVADSTLLVQEGMGRKIGDGINFVAMAVGSIVLAFTYGWELALVLIAFTPLMGASAFYMSKAITVAVQSAVTSYAQAGGIAEESLANAKTVHMFNAVADRVDKYKDALQHTQRAGVAKGIAVGVGTGVMYLIMLGTYALGMYYGTVKITNDQLGDNVCTGSRCYDAGRVITVFFCVVMGSMAIGQAGPSIQAIATARTAAFDIFALLARTSAVDASSTVGLKLDTVRGDIALEHVEFAYPSRPHVKVCAGYSLVVPAGQTLALVGASGSGKSTIVGLLERFYDPLGGRVLLDGHDLKTLNVQWLRTQFGLVGQEPTLFADTIAGNIRHGRPDASLDDVIQAAKQANAYDFIVGFPLGFDTPVGHQGAQMSGGQKQRIAIARAIIKNPAVLLLDEATSALDTESERVVQASLDRLVAMRKRTTIVIAHRLSTIRHADRIVVLETGRVVEDGTHDSLVQLEHGLYHALVQAQERRASPSIDQRQSLNVRTIPSKEASVVAPSSGETNHDGKNTIVGAITSSANASISGCNDDENTTTEPVPISRVWRLSAPEWWHVLLGSVGAILHGSLYPVWGVILTKCTLVFFQVNLGIDGMRSESLKWSMGFVGLGVAMLIAVTIQKHQFSIVCERLTTRIRVMCFGAMLRQDMAWFDDPLHAPGALTTCLATDSAAIQTMTAETLNAILLNASTLGVALGVSFYYSWRMTLVFMAVIPLMGVAAALQMQMETAQTGKGGGNDGDIQAGAVLSEAIHAIRTVASFNLERRTQDVYMAQLQRSAALDRRAGYRGGVAYSVAQSSVLFAIAAVFYYGGYLVRQSLLDFEGMFMVLNSILFCSFGVGMAAQALGDIRSARKSITRIFSIVDQQQTIDTDSTTGLVLSHVDGVVEFKNVAFSYPSRQQSAIYTNYSLKIEAGQTVALVGGSGSGKSTAINLIERFYDPTAGSVTLDGHDITTINLHSLRSHISLVSQEPVLFSGTIGSNIAMGKRGATQADIEDAATKANAHNFILQFPDGYDTPVGDRGVQVSGGQKQRIALARAIIRDPAILLLDEATSALDNESERIVQASLDQLLQMKRRTTIVVAHRLSTIRHADVIAVVDGGGIAEIGTHDQLVAIPKGMYANLVARQMMQ